MCCLIYIDRNAGVYRASIECVVEKNDYHYLQRAMKKVLMNKKLDSCKLIKELYASTFVQVVDILEHNEKYSKKMVRALQADIKLGFVEGDAKDLPSALTVADLLESFNIPKKWDDTDILHRMVDCLPEGERALAIWLLEKHEMYLDVYSEAVKLKDSLKLALTTPEETNAQVPVEVTLAKEIAEFTRKDCKEMLDLLLCMAFNIPRNKVTVIQALSGGSTTVVCIIDKAFMQNLIQCPLRASVLWAFQELSITRMQVGLFEVNVSQMLSQHFKDALRRGLTGDMDFVGATKVCGKL